jgi:hypothetical protein
VDQFSATILIMRAAQLVPLGKSAISRICRYSIDDWNVFLVRGLSSFVDLPSRGENEVKPRASNPVSNKTTLLKGVNKAQVKPRASNPVSNKTKLLEKPKSKRISKRKMARMDEKEAVVDFQKLLSTRWKKSCFLTAADITLDGKPQKPLFTAVDYKAAMDRAILAGRAALPYHQTVEPYKFVRFLGPSAIAKLADIARENFICQNKEDDSYKNDTQELLEAADHCREKWIHVPCFMVVLMTPKEEIRSSKTERATNYGDKNTAFSGSETDKTKTIEGTTGETDTRVGDVIVNTIEPVVHDVDSSQPYEFCPHRPLFAGLELKQFTLAISASQNVVLSLRAEDLACDHYLSGPPFIYTPAFRLLVQAGERDRVVSVIAIGQHKNARRYHFYRGRLAVDRAIVDIL